MKKCTIGLFSKIVTFLVFAVLFVPLTGIAFYFAFIYPQTQHKERLIFLAGLVMCVDLLGYAIYRMFYLGLVWTEYDMEKAVPVGGNTGDPCAGRASGRWLYFLYPGKEEAEKDSFEPAFKRL